MLSTIGKKKQNKRGIFIPPSYLQDFLSGIYKTCILKILLVNVHKKISHIIIVLNNLRVYFLPYKIVNSKHLFTITNKVDTISIFMTLCCSEIKSKNLCELRQNEAKQTKLKLDRTMVNHIKCKETRATQKSRE